MVRGVKREAKHTHMIGYNVHYARLAFSFGLPRPHHSLIGGTLVLNISCQHLGEECELESFCAPLGRRVGECTFFNIYVGIEYIMPTLGGSM